MELFRDGKPRVVVTGMGTVSALGDIHHLWDSLKQGRSGISRITTIPTDHVIVKIGGEIKNFDPTGHIERKEIRRMGRASQLAVVASKMALSDAGLGEFDHQTGERVSVVVGTSLGAHEMSERSTTKYKTSGYQKPNPLALINSLPNMPAHYVSRFFQTFGHLLTPSTACAAGTQSIGIGADIIQANRADIVIAGSVESILQDYTLAGFEAMKALATAYNDCPELASRPFDLNRSGFVFSEGCGIVILERLEHALARDALPLAEVLGYASSSDAHHVAAIDPSGMGATRCMTWALRDSGCHPTDIDYINAHGTSTPSNDRIETLAIKRVFKEHAFKVPISSTKSMLGHALAGSGSIEFITCVQALRERVLPPTINLDTPDPECDLDYVPNTARDVKLLRRIMSNSFGLGGQNASIVLGAI